MLAVGQSITIGVAPYTEADLVCVWKITVSLQTISNYNYIMYDILLQEDSKSCVACLFVCV